MTAAASVEVDAAASAGAGDRQASYRNILRSSAAIGAASLVNVLAAMLRAKVIAVLLGPAGTGLAGLFGAIVDTTRGIALLGIGSSGVRQIAAASAGGDVDRVATVACVVRRVAVVLGAGGALVLLAGHRWIATFTFGSDVRGPAVALLGAAVLLGVLADAQAAVLQGTRRIAALAQVSVATAASGSLLTAAMVLAFGEAGIAPGIVATAAATALAATWQVRRLRLRAPPLRFDAVAAEAVPLLRLGMAFVGSSLAVLGAAYAARVIVLHGQGLAAAGLYQGAWTVGGMYVGFVLQAMSTDFYPRLVAAGRDDAVTNRLVNEQAEVSMLLAAPGVLATLTLAPVVLGLLYSSRFDGATEVLRWICLGMAMRVVTWPMGYILVARGHQALFLASDIAWALFNVAATWLCVRRFGLEGAGIAFFASYVFHAALVYPLVRRASGFRWTAANLRLALAMNGVAAAVLLVFRTVPAAWAAAVGVLLSASAACYGALRVWRLAQGTAPLPGFVRRLRARLISARGRGRAARRSSHGRCRPGGGRRRPR